MSLLAVVLLVVGLVLLVGGAELLVRGAAHLAVVLGISPLVVGLTIVAFGTSAPELAVGVQSSLQGSTELALGNVVGSNIFNTLVILGVSALAVPLVVHQKLVRREVPLVIVASAAVLAFAPDGSIGRGEGALLFLAAIGYTAWAVVVERREPDEVAAEYEAEYGDTGEAGRPWVADVALLVAGLALLTLGSRWLVEGAVDIAEAMGLSELVIGLTVVAAGTSLPEAATSLVASIRGERDIAVGNVLGSNLFNLLFVLGAAAVVAPGGVPVPDGAVRFDLPVLLGAAVLTLGVAFTGFTIRRWEGGVLVGLFAAYLVHLVLDANGSAALPTFRTAMVPVLAVIAAVMVTRMVRHARSRGTLSADVDARVG